jgi:hypothetical protein
VTTSKPPASLGFILGMIVAAVYLAVIEIIILLNLWSFGFYYRSGMMAHIPAVVTQAIEFLAGLGIVIYIVAMFSKRLFVCFLSVAVVTIALMMMLQALTWGVNAG